MRKLRSQGPSRSRAPPRAQSPGPKIPQVAKRNAFATCSSAALHARKEPCQKAWNDANVSKRSASTRCSCRGEKEPGARRTVPKDTPKEVLREANLANRQVERPTATHAAVGRPKKCGAMAPWLNEARVGAGAPPVPTDTAVSTHVLRKFRTPRLRRPGLWTVQPRTGMNSTNRVLLPNGGVVPLVLRGVGLTS